MIHFLFGRWQALTAFPVLLAMGLLAAAAHAAEPASSSADTVPSVAAAAERGRALYEDARRADGSRLTAERDGLGTVSGDNAACAACHRRSTFGNREAALLVPPLAGHLLFAPLQRQTLIRASTALQRQELRAYDRPAYTQASLGAALHEGIDPAGRRLGPAMPRYRLTAAELADLSAHLNAVSQRQPPGVDADRVHLASVITPQATPQARATVEVAMRAWSASARVGRKRVEWRVWQLQGPPESWAAQLEAYWREQAVFAMVSGAGGGDWQAVSDFCEARLLPCLFPTLERAPANAPRQYTSVYLSTGVDAEAALLARLLNEPGTTTPSRVLSLGVAGDVAAASASDVLQHALKARGQTLRRLAVEKPYADDVAQALSAMDADEVAMLWLRAAELQAVLQRLPPPAAALEKLGQPSVPRVWLSATLAPPHRTSIPAAWRPYVAWASVHADRTRREAGGALSSALWAAALALPNTVDPVVLADVHAATFFFTDGLARMREGLSGEYLLERLEAAVDLRPAGSGYFRPGQRVAAQGGHALVFASPQATMPQSSGRFLSAEPPSD